MAAKKISALSSNTSPLGTSVVPIVESSSTEKTTLEDIYRYGKRKWSGWFQVTNITAQTGIGTSETVLTIDGDANTITHLPTYIGDALTDVFTVGAGAKLLFGNTPVGTHGVIRLSGVLTTGAASAAYITCTFYDSGDSEIESYVVPLLYYNTTVSDDEWMVSIPFFASSDLVDSGYAKFSITFAAGTGHAVTVSEIMTQFTLV